MASVRSEPESTYFNSLELYTPNVIIVMPEVELELG